MRQSIPRGLEGQVYRLGYELEATWHWPTFIQVTQVNCSNGKDIDDSSINTVLFI